MFNSVLIIDSEDGHHGLATALKDSGYWVIEEDSSGDGLRRAVEESPSVIIIDEDMAPIDGVDLLPVIRSFTESLIVVLGTEGGQNAAQSLLQGADVHISRPLNIKEVLLRIQALLRRHGPGKVTTFTNGHSTNGHSTNGNGFHHESMTRG